LSFHSRNAIFGRISSSFDIISPKPGENFDGTFLSIALLLPLGDRPIGRLGNQATPALAAGASVRRPGDQELVEWELGDWGKEFLIYDF
jgi:hypothetical protein